MPGPFPHTRPSRAFIIVRSISISTRTRLSGRQGDKLNAFTLNTEGIHPLSQPSTAPRRSVDAPGQFIVSFYVVRVWKFVKRSTSCLRYIRRAGRQQASVRCIQDNGLESVSEGSEPRITIKSESKKEFLTHCTARLCLSEILNYDCAGAVRWNARLKLACSLTFCHLAQFFSSTDFRPARADARVKYNSYLRGGFYLLSLVPHQLIGTNG